MRANTKPLRETRNDNAKAMNFYAASFGKGPTFDLEPAPAARQRTKAGFRGCSDILGQMRDGRLIAIECKAERGRVSPEQQAFLDTVRQHGGVSGVARGVADAELIIKHAGTNPAPVQWGQGAGRARAVPDQPAHAPTLSPVTDDRNGRSCQIERG